MATLALTAIGSVAGSALLPAGLSVFGTAISGAALGQAAGALVGNYIDQALFGSSGQSRVVEGARLSDLQVLSSTEGAAIPRLYGRARLGGQIIWATHLEEEILKTSQTSSSGGKGGFSTSSAPTSTQIDYRYYANFAVALCEGQISRIGRVWADGKEIDLSGITYRIYKGSEDQTPDSLIEAKEGSGFAPAYRGLCYIVFERLALERFGNRIPQLNFEVFRPVDDFSDQVNAVTLIPGAGEFMYDVQEVTRDQGGVTVSENVHTRQGGSNWTVALNELEDSLPNARTTALVVSWFGTDLRAGSCQVKPGVENNIKVTSPASWSVAGQNRNTAYIVSENEVRPAYGGTPSDGAVVAAIKDLKERGIKSTFYPFLLMDIPSGNTLQNPYTGTAGQPVYPWRGRITVHPAPGQAGSPDKSAAAATQIANFVGTAQISDFAISGESVIYTGPAEWSYRRMILHYAHLCKAAGGVDHFLLGSELKGLTQVRQSASLYPFVTALVQLASDVKTILGTATKVTYAADWSEYFGHHPHDGSGDVYFNLDPLWSSSHIDAVGIDLYWPLSDWRDGTSHLDYQAGTRSIYDLSYLKGNIRGGEGYDWYYASASDRISQTRTPITDGLGKSWMFRFKDIQAWWSNTHYNRPAGVESVSATGWSPQSKPIWFTEVGCPALDKAANQPNVFYDPKSSESKIPYFSKATRDDAIQRRYLQAVHEFFDPAHEGYVTGSNPLSSVYSGRMVDLNNIYVYTWDARPFPAFPFQSSVWGDAENWTLGHWITGRVSDAPLSQTISRILTDYGFSDFDTSRLYGNLQGVVIDRIMSAREALQPLELSFFVDSYESEGKIRFRHRGQDEAVYDVTSDDLVEASETSGLYTLTRAQETELPAVAKLSYIDSTNDYRQAAVEARRQVMNSQRVSTAQLPIVLEQHQAQSIAEIWLYDIWSARERAEFILPPSRLALEPADIIRLQDHASDPELRITEMTDGAARKMSALSVEKAIYDVLHTPARTGSVSSPQVFGKSKAVFMDLPLLNDQANPSAGYVAAWQSPWPGAVAFYRSPDTSGFVLNSLTLSPAIMGVSQTDFKAGPTSRWDYGNDLIVQLYDGQLQSAEELAVFNGANLAAIENSQGNWEVFQFRSAELLSPKTYKLSQFLRGQGGTEWAMENNLLAGARFILLDEAVTQVQMSRNEISLPFNWKYGPSNKNISHQSYSDSVRGFSGLGFKPLSPVHVSGQRAGQDLVISWIRRSRLGGDSWEIPEIPLGEDSEVYDIEILDGATIKRTLFSSIPRVIYTESDQIADWGTVQSGYTIRVYQVSGTVGRGIAKEVSING